MMRRDDGETPISWGGYKPTAWRSSSMTMERPQFRGVVTKSGNAAIISSMMERPPFLWGG